MAGRNSESFLIELDIYIYTIMPVKKIKQNIRVKKINAAFKREIRNVK